MGVGIDRDVELNRLQLALKPSSGRTQIRGGHGSTLAKRRQAMKRDPYEFERYVKELFEQLGYRARPQEEIYVRRADMIIERTNELYPECILIECKTGETELINADTFAKLNSTYQENRGVLGLTAAIFVFDCKVSQHVQRAALQRPDGAQLLSIAQLEARVVGVSLTQLAERAFSEFEAIPAFVDPGVTDVATENFAQDSLAEIERHSRSKGNFIFLIGEIGSGKTALLTQFARRMNTPPNFTVYLTIPLRHYDPVRHRDSLLESAAHHLRETGMLDGCNTRILKSLLTLRLIVLIFDGIDEMRLSLSDEQTFELLLQWIDELRDTHCVIFSCRSSYFNTYFAQFINERSQRNISTTVLRVQPFDMDAILRYARLSGAISAVATFERHDATELMKRPLFLSTAQRLPDLWRLIEQSISDVEFIEASISMMLQHSSMKRVVRRDTSEWIEFLTKLAGRMLGGAARLDRSVVKAALEEQWSGRVTESDLEKLTRDAMFRSILEGSADGFEFAHSVFEEYFVGRAVNRIELLSLAGLLHLDSRDASSNFGLASYDHFLREKMQNPDNTAFREKYGMRWCKIGPGIAILRTLDSKSREVRRFRPIKNEFWISQTPLTAAQIRDRLHLLRDPHLTAKIRRELNSYETAAKPLTYITHKQAQQICTELFGGRLPDLAEWQWACMPFQTDGYYKQQDTQSSIPSADDLSIGSWGVKGGLRSVWQWTTTYDNPSRSYVCCGGWWGDGFDGTREWKLLPRRVRHLRTGVRVVIDGKNFDRQVP